MSTSSSEAVDALAGRVRAVHRAFPTGVTVVTTSVGGRPYGLAVNAFASVSLDPPTLLVCVARSAVTHAHLLGAEHVVVNVLSHRQRDVAAVFARSGGDKFAQLAWRPGATGGPVLDGVAGHFEMRVDERLSVHTHTIFLGTVVEAAASGLAPLVYLGGRFHDGAELPPALEAAGGIDRPAVA